MTIRELLGLICILTGVLMIGCTTKAVTVRSSVKPVVLEALIVEFDPVQPPIQCPLRVVMMEPEDLDEVWVFAVPSTCAVI